jgi:phosphoglycerate dehydrogenase-like enzyme
MPADIAKTKLLWPSSPRVEYTDVPPEVERSFQDEFPEVAIVVARSEKTFEAHLSDCEILVAMNITPHQFARCRKLRWIHSPMAGITPLLFPELVASHVILTNASTVHAVPVAEHTLALLLALARRLLNCFRYQAEWHWGQEDSWQPGKVPFELQGKTLGLVGLGTIGRELIARVRPLGMRVLATKRDPSRGGEFADRVYAPHELPILLAEADFLVLAAPETSETRHLIGKSELARMKPGAYLINVSRGTLVDTEALLEALSTGRLAGAALDVTDPEPLPPDHPLWKLPNVLITPHLGGASSLFWQRESVLLRENLHRYLAGKPLLNLVDKSLGY